MPFPTDYKNIILFFEGSESLVGFGVLKGDFINIHLTNAVHRAQLTPIPERRIQIKVP